MFLTLGDRIVEVKGYHIALALVIILILLAGGIWMVFSKLNLGSETQDTVSSSKVPWVEKAVPVQETGEKDLEEIAETTTSTLTSTTEKKSLFKRKSKDEDLNVEQTVHKNCSFYGKGHDAILMPSGNYYCRSTENRVSIFVDGVERICCVTP